ncbi:MAG: hypothetical protein ABJB10_12895 [Mesorhizobium sp.]
MEALAQWGRSEAAPVAVAPSKLGKRSVMLALVAFAAGTIGIVTLVAMPRDASELTQNIATGYFMVVFLLVAPIMHIVGVICGAMALARSNDNRALGLVGIILNGLSVLAGVLILLAMASTIGAFT